LLIFSEIILTPLSEYKPFLWGGVFKLLAFSDNMNYEEKIGGADFIFGEEGDSLLPGAFTPEALGLALDPLRRELKTLPMILARFLGLKFLRNTFFEVQRIP
jgi:hypothetical protein